MNDQDNEKQKSRIVSYIIISCMTVILMMIAITLIDISDFRGKIGVQKEVGYNTFDVLSNIGVIDSINYTKGDEYFYFTVEKNVLNSISRELHNANSIRSYAEDTMIIETAKSLGLEAGYGISLVIAALDTETLYFIKNMDSSEVIFSCTYPDYDEFTHEMLKKGISVKVNEKTEKVNWFSIIMTIIPVAVFLLVYRGIYKHLSNADRFNFNEKDLIPEVPKKGFESIGGHWETKKELSDIINLINNKQSDPEKTKYIPKGYLLTGPPGTGKTALARAIAHETKCKFLYVCTSDFIRFYVGQGASNVKKLMEIARNNSPCIIFLDEIDSLGKRGTNRGHSENDQTLNTLLTEIDGFKNEDDIIFIGATNFEENVDPALIRAGRLERRIKINLPERGERLEILKIYLQDIKYDDSVDVELLAEQTAGFSGADIENLVKTAVLETIINNTELVTAKDFDESFFKIVMRGNKRQRIDPELKAKRNIIAYHESGHTLAHYIFEGTAPSKVTIIPSTSGAGGVTITPPGETLLKSKRYLKNQVKIFYGGRIAEEYLLKNDDDITVGAQQDIAEATKILNEIVNYYGMNGYMINYALLEKEDNNIKQVERLAKELYREAYDVIFKNGYQLEKLAARLLEKETLDKQEIEEILLDNALCET